MIPIEAKRRPAFAGKVGPESPAVELVFAELLTRRTLGLVYLKNNAASQDRQNGTLAGHADQIGRASLNLTAVVGDTAGERAKYAAKKTIRFPPATDPGSLLRGRPCDHWGNDGRRSGDCADDDRAQRDAMNCRPECGACCIAPSISSPIPGMPQGKPAGARCVQLLPDLRCALFGRPERPAVCVSLRPTEDMCGCSRAEAMARLEALERATAPGAPGNMR